MPIPLKNWLRRLTGRADTVAPLAPAANSICVLGMHRSGTSCLTGILQNFGVELGEVFTENPHNKRGNRENSRIVFLNEALLTYNDAAWNKPAVISK